MGKIFFIGSHSHLRQVQRRSSICQDTAGQEKFHALGPIYYRESNGAVLVYDITDESSFQKVF